jgi:hypothetical protein
MGGREDRRTPAFANLSADLSAEALAKAEGYGEARKTVFSIARHSLAYMMPPDIAWPTSSRRSPCRTIRLSGLGGLWRRRRL